MITQVFEFVIYFLFNECVKDINKQLKTRRCMRGSGGDRSVDCEFDEFIHIRKKALTYKMIQYMKTMTKIKEKLCYHIDMYPFHEITPSYSAY